MDDITDVTYSQEDAVLPIVAAPTLTPDMPNRQTGVGGTDFVMPSLPCSRPHGAAPRPERYDGVSGSVPLTPPSSPTNLRLVFDSSKIYYHHPHKYRLLLETENNSGNSSDAKQSSNVHSNDITSQSKAISTRVLVKGGHVISMGTTSSRDPMSEPKMITGTRLVPVMPSEALSGAHGTKPGSARDPVSGTDGGSLYVPQQFLHSFKAATSRPNPALKTTGGTEPPVASSTSAQSRVSQPLPSSRVHSTQEMAEGANPPCAASESNPSRGSPAMESGCLTMQPSPRRLFGFGPHYRPLPETVCSTEGKMGRSSSNPNLTGHRGLSDAVGQEGLTGARYQRGSLPFMGDDADGKTAAGVGVASEKPSPTPAEVNAWLPGSF